MQSPFCVTGEAKNGGPLLNRPIALRINSVTPQCAEAMELLKVREIRKELELGLEFYDLRGDGLTEGFEVARQEILGETKPLIR